MKLPMMRIRLLAALFSGATLAAAAIPGFAQTDAPIVVLGSVAVRGALDKLGPMFEKTSGRKVVIQYDSAAALASRAATGEGYDVVVTSVGAVDGFVKTGAVAADTEAVVGTAVASLVYKHGTPKPDISSPDALKAVLLAAKSISFSDPAAGGAQRLGISDAVMQKATLTKVGEGAIPVGTGQTQYAVAQSSEYAVIPGLDGVPIFPADPKSTSKFAAAVSTKSAQPDAARAFVIFMRSPDGTAVRNAMGLGGG